MKLSDIGRIITEGRVKELDQDLKDKKMSDADFKQKYNKSKADAKKEINPKKKSVKEATGDEQFDKMMGNITGNTQPIAMGKQGSIDRKTMELTHKIFLALRDYDDPRVTQKFKEFMAKTIGIDNIR